MIAKRRADMLAWYHATMRDPVVAETAASPAAKLIREAVEAYCVRSARKNFLSNGVEVQRFIKAVAEAKKGGANHPLIQYWAVRFPSDGTNPMVENPAGTAEVYRATTKNLPTAKYGAVWKMHMAWNSFVGLKQSLANPAAKVTPSDVQEALDRFWKEFAAAAADPNPFTQYEVYFITGVVAQFRPPPLANLKMAWQATDKALAAAGAPKATRLTVEGQYLVSAAWEARGSGVAGTVTGNGWQVFKQSLAAAEKCLTAAWDSDPSSPVTAALMIQVNIGTSGDRDDMEKWFRRAMEVDPDYQQACGAKLDWLRPQWHGSQREMFEFAYQCFRTGNWYAGLPLVLENPTNYRPNKNNPAVRPFYAYPVKWANTEAIYRGFLKEYPDDRWALSQLALESSVAGKWETAAELYDRIADKPWPGVFKDQREYEQRRDFAKGSAKRAAEK